MNKCVLSNLLKNSRKYIINKAISWHTTKLLLQLQHTFIKVRRLRIFSKNLWLSPMIFWLWDSGFYAGKYLQVSFQFQRWTLSVLCCRYNDLDRESVQNTKYTINMWINHVNTFKSVYAERNTHIYYMTHQQESSYRKKKQFDWNDALQNQEEYTSLLHDDDERVKCVLL